MLGVKVFVSSEQVSDLLEHHKSELMKLKYKFPVGKLMGKLCTYCMYYKKIILDTTWCMAAYKVQTFPQN